MCVKCKQTCTYGPAPVDYTPDWEAIPTGFNELRISDHGSVWAISATGRLKLKAGKGQSGNHGVGKTFRGGLDGTLVQGWKVLATRPPTQKLYVLLAPGSYPTTLYGTEVYALERLRLAGVGAELHLLTEVAKVQEVHTTTIEIVRSK